MKNSEGNKGGENQNPAQSSVVGRCKRLLFPLYAELVKDLSQLFINIFAIIVIHTGATMVVGESPFPAAMREILTFVFDDNIHEQFLNDYIVSSELKMTSLSYGCPQTNSVIGSLSLLTYALI